VIVKKVPTSKAAPAKSKALNVRALVDYIAGPMPVGADAKVEHRGALNLLNIDHEGQVQEMIDLAETARRSPQPVQHWIMSWRPGEQPTARHAEEAVGTFLDEMGLGEHQVIYALHRDTDNWHLHLAVNRVHPETEKLVTVNNGFDHEVAHRAIARIERLQGWEREPHALYELRPDGRLERPRPRGEAERQPSAQARDFEERAGECSAERIAIGEAAPIIQRAGSWGELHQALAERGMRYEKKGSGALLWVGGQPVKASAAGRDCSLSALRKRLGELEPGSLVVPALAAPRPLEPTAPLLPAYIQERRKHDEERDSACAAATGRQREERRRLADRQQRERADIFRGSWKGRGALLNATRSVLAARQAQDKAELRERHQLEWATLRREKGRFPSYEEWVAQRNRDRAEEWRHRERRPATIEGRTFDQPAPRDIRAFAAVVAGRTVDYHLAGARGAPAFTDRGKRIDIHDSRRRESILAALQLSAQKWGTFNVHGDEKFKRICVELAAEHGFRIANPELLQAIEAERAHPRTENTRACDDRESPRPAPTHAEVYRRHRDDIARDSRDQLIHPSRIDAQIALRMRVTGHSREAIVEAISSAAPGTRPDEQRNWNVYAKHAVDFAFGAAGSRFWEEISSQQQRLLKLEGRHLERDVPPGGPFSRFM
jgi:hypothetical protein